MLLFGRQVVPQFLSFRKDSLIVQCGVAALKQFVPVNLVALGLLFRYYRVESRQVNPSARLTDVNGAIEAWKTTKGFEGRRVEVEAGRPQLVKVYRS